MRMLCVLLVLLSAGASTASTQTAPIDPVRAAKYFDEAKSESAADGGRLWGVELYGPMIFVAPATSEIVANQADAEGKLTQNGTVWTGKLPPEIGAANTSLDWAGVNWTMVMWPVPIYPRDRASLLMHESFHRVQKKLGLPARDAVNSQLDTLHGRIWLELEWRALERALAEPADAKKRNRALEDALQFRAWRRKLFPGANGQEDALEMNEGLAEYTGERLANPTSTELRAAAIQKLRSGPKRKSFARSFAYVSGPAYGALLDFATQPAGAASWRKGLTPDSDFGALVERAYGLSPAPPTGDAVKARIVPYDGDALISEETEREKRQQAAIASARARFVDGPLLVLLVVKNFGYSFDPNNVIALDENLSLYTPAKVSDDWGVLECSKGVVLAREKGLIVRAQVPAPGDPEARPVKIDGCTLSLNPGWTLEPGEREGDFVLKLAP